MVGRRGGAAGHQPRLCNPYEAKRRMELTNKTNRLDAQELERFLTENGAETRGIGGNCT